MKDKYISFVYLNLQENEIKTIFAEKTKLSFSENKALQIETISHFSKYYIKKKENLISKEKIKFLLFLEEVSSFFKGEEKVNNNSFNDAEKKELMSFLGESDYIVLYSSTNKIDLFENLNTKILNWNLFFKENIENKIKKLDYYSLEDINNLLKKETITEKEKKQIILWRNLKKYGFSYYFIDYMKEVLLYRIFSRKNEKLLNFFFNLFQ